MVTGLKEKTSDDTIKLYFENTRRSGGNFVNHVERKTKDSTIVHFKDPTSKGKFACLFSFYELLTARNTYETRYHV